MTDLARLVRAAQDGDRPAFGELYAQYARAVHGIVLSRVSRTDVEDLVQDVFLIAMQRVRTLGIRKHLEAGWQPSREIARPIICEGLLRPPS